MSLITGVNRSERTDSPFELDEAAEWPDDFAMRPGPGHLQLLVFERRDPAQNMARFYVLSLEPALFGDDVALVREWGRLGSRGRRRLELYSDAIVATEALEIWLKRKIRRGYTLVCDQTRALAADKCELSPSSPQGRSAHERGV